MTLIKNFWNILSNKQKSQGIFVLILMILVSILETFGIALIIPIMSTILEQSGTIKAQLSLFLFHNSAIRYRFYYFRDCFVINFLFV